MRVLRGVVGCGVLGCPLVCPGCLPGLCLVVCFVVGRLPWVLGSCGLAMSGFGLFALSPGCGLLVWLAFSLLVPSCGSFLLACFLLVAPVCGWLVDVYQVFSVSG